MNHSLLLMYAGLVWSVLVIPSQHTITTLITDPSKQYPIPTLFHLATQVISREFQRTIHSSQCHDTDTREALWNTIKQPSLMFTLSEPECALNNIFATTESPSFCITPPSCTSTHKKIQNTRARLIATLNKKLSTTIQKTIKSPCSSYAIPLDGSLAVVITDHNLFIWSCQDAQLLNSYPISIKNVHDCAIIRNSIAICEAKKNHHIKIEWIPLYTIAQKLYVTGLINIATTHHCSPEAFTFFQSIDPATLSIENAEWTDEETQKVMALKISALTACTATPKNRCSCGQN